ncbi:MAG: lipoate--protein ligase family protein [Chloroflexi bacterium]|nr:lipoate--protein ligase family protein [Chloroflexota bacterium]
MSPAPGAANMALDEALLELQSQGLSVPTLRTYGWEPPCLSLGYFQSARGDVDLEACRQRGVDLVRRPTGGRAVLHHRELTYALTAPADHPLVSGGIKESYAKISQGLLLGLARLGVAARAERRGKAGAWTGACFEVASDYELVAGGKKVVGSAQLRRRGMLLQHGSLLLDFDADALLELLELPSGMERGRVAAYLRGRVASLKELLGREVGLAEAAQALRAGFQAAWGVELAPGELTAAERAMAARLEAKYRSEAWNLRQ